MARRASSELRRGLATRVARRLFATFLVAALAPVALLAGIAAWQVGGTLREQAERRLDRAARTTAMSVLERADAIGIELDALWSAARTGALPAPLAARAGERLASVGWYVDGVRRAAVGDAPARLPAGVARRTPRRPGFSQLEIGVAPDGSAALELLRATPDGAGLVLATLRRDELLTFSSDDTLPLDAVYCILDAARRPLHCSAPDAPTSLARVGPGWLAVEREVFLRSTLGAESWWLVLAEPSSVGLASVTAFRRAFALAALAGLGMAVLFSAVQVRRQLAPLRALRDGALRIAERDFDAPVPTASGDEFGELARAFGSMAGALRRHDAAQGALIGLDRALLGAADEEALVDVLAEGTRHLLGARDLLVVRCWPGGLGGLRWASRDDRGLAATGEGLSPALFERVREARDPFELELDESTDAGLGPLRRAGLSRVFVLPLRGPATGVLGLVALALADESAEARSLLRYGQQLAQQVAAAIESRRLEAAHRLLRDYDRVTGLANRSLFHERLAAALAASATRGHRVAVGIVGIAGLRRVKDALGHEAADELLREEGQRLRRALAPSLVARLSEAEFGVLQEDDPSAGLAVERVDAALATLGDRLQVDGADLFLAGHAGVAVGPQDGATAAALLRSADAALTAARAGQRHATQLYSESMGAGVRTRLEIEADLHRALENGELRVCYQPVVSVGTRELVGAEALVRWNHPQRGPLGPDLFVPIAEESDLIVRLGEYVLREACREARRFCELAGGPFRVAVNVSGRQLGSSGFLRRVSRILRETGMPPHSLAFELTERVLVEGDAGTLQLLQGLRDLGIALALDDFGTGYSSLAYLKRFPIDTVKIDRSFVMGLPADSDGAAIVHAVIAMASGLGLSVTAEGVEGEAQLAFLQAAGCDAAQGYLFSAALPASEFAKRMELEPA